MAVALEDAYALLLEAGGSVGLESASESTADPNPLCLTVRERNGSAHGGRLVYVDAAERPGLALWWLDSTGALVDFSSSTFSLKIGSRGATAALTKTSGIVGATGDGVSPTGLPNVEVTFDAGDLDITAGTYLAQLVADNERVAEFTLTILDAID